MAGWPRAAGRIPVDSGAAANSSGSRLACSRLADGLPPDATRAVSGVVSARECEASENLRRWSPPKSRGRGTDTSSDLGAGVAMFGGEMIVGGRIIVSLTAGLNVGAPPPGRTYAQDSGPTLRLCVDATGSLADDHGARAIAADRELATAGESREDAEAADRPIARAFPWAESAELSVRVTVWA